MEKPINTHHPCRVVNLVQKKHCAGGELPTFEKKTGELKTPQEPENHSPKSMQLIKHVPILAVLTPPSSDSSSPTELIDEAEHG